MSYADQFNQTVDQFFVDIDKMIPGQTAKLNELKTMFSMDKFMGYHIDLFFTGVEPYKKQLFSEDASIFLDSASQLPMASSMNIHEYWNDLTEENHSVMWTSFKKLYLLAYLHKGNKDDDFGAHIEM